MPKKKATWGDIFTDTTTYADDMVIAVKDAQGNEVSHTLGDLRAYNEEHDGALLQSLEPEREKIKADKKAVEDAQQEVLRLYHEGGKLKDKVDSGKKVNKEDVADQLDLDESDPLVGQVVKAINKVKGDSQQKIEALTAAVAQHGNILKTVLGTYINRSTADQYRGLQASIEALPDKVRSKYSLKALREHAEKHKWNDEDGMPDLSRAFNDMGREDVYEARRARDRAEDRKQWEQEQRLKTVRESESRHVHGDKLAKSTIDVRKSKDILGDAIAQASQDDEMWDSIAKANVAGTA